MARTKPNDEALASFCWWQDTSIVERILNLAQRKLDVLRQGIGEAKPFPRTNTPMRTFSEKSWIDWIDSIRSIDTGHLEVLQRLVVTCRIRLGYDLRPNGEDATLPSNSSQDSGAAGGIGMVISGGTVSPPVTDGASLPQVPDKPFSKFGSILRSMRDRQSLSQAETAKRIGIPQPHFSRIENGEALPSDEQLQDLANLYDIDIGEMRAHARADSGQDNVGAQDRVTLSDSVSMHDELRVTLRTSASKSKLKQLQPLSAQQ
jgi:transcriptional regulator with XRE-family HTH domain